MDELVWIRELVWAIKNIADNWAEGDLAGAVNSAEQLADEACQHYKIDPQGVDSRIDIK